MASNQKNIPAWEYPKADKKVIHHKAVQTEVAVRVKTTGKVKRDKAGKVVTKIVTVPAYDQVVN